MLSSGNIKKANKFLGRNFTINSTVIEGQKLGRKLGFPTANLFYPDDVVKIPHGVYCAKVFDKPAVLNWGIKPTIGSEQEVIEVHILNYNRDLYGKEIMVEILDKVRDERKFNSLEELKKQIKEDIKQCLEL